MSIQEMSDQFDVLWNNVSSNQAPGLNEYEKSVFLTKAQSQLVKEYFNSRLDSVGGGFDGSQKRQYDFSVLIKTEELQEVTNFIVNQSPIGKIDRRSEVFLFPIDYFLTVNEILSDSRWQYSVLPIDYAEYQRLMLKPYSLPVKRAAWRLITNKMVCSCIAEFQVSGGNTFAVDTWPSCDTTSIFFEYDDGEHIENCKLECDSIGWSNGKFNVSLTLMSEQENYFDNNEKAVKAIKDGFKQLTTILNIYSVNTDLTLACRYTNGFVLASGSSEEEGGGTYTVNNIHVPMVEIIGKFKGTLHYKLRYVRNLKPIILEDLTNYGDDLTIDNITTATECELPEECHEEILERAVTLAKIAWQGGTSTQAAAASRNRRDED